MNYILSAPEPEDLDFLFRIENDPITWIVSDNHMPYSRYALKQYILTCKNDFYSEKQLRLMVRPEGERTAVAIVDLFAFSPLDERAEVGIIVDPALRQRGIGTAAIQLLDSYAAHTLGLDLLAAYIADDNQASINLFRKNGYDHVATLPEWVQQDGKRKNLIVLRKKLKKN